MDPSSQLSPVMKLSLDAGVRHILSRSWSTRATRQTPAIPYECDLIRNYRLRAHSRAPEKGPPRARLLAAVPGTRWLVLQRSARHELQVVVRQGGRREFARSASLKRLASSVSSGKYPPEDLGEIRHTIDRQDP
jgi:hypothetical protein